MVVLFPYIIAFPLAGFLILALCRGLPRRATSWIGVGSIGLSAALSLVAWQGRVFGESLVLWRWIDVVGFHASIGLTMDWLSGIMTVVVTFVGFLIHLYSTRYMRDDEGYRRFFAYMNLFIASMLVLVLADNLLLLYVGWEGVGLCSYLLIGFWYKDAANGRAAMKAFIVTRVGDAAMAVGMFLLFWELGTLDIQAMLHQASVRWATGSPLAVAAAALLLAGAVGKSAQLPLQTWLPDAMAGPTPVSALIHAATMVTAGVYLIARMYNLFLLAPAVLLTVGVIGAATLLLAGFSALTQRDIKRVLAYSTISQIGYMFLALSAGNPPMAQHAAMFHFMTHAFFKALLFLAAGVVILAMHHEQDMFKMGGLRRATPLAFWTFLIGAGSLSAVPIVTAGFYSKDALLSMVWLSRPGVPWLWCAGVLGAFLTSLYTFRMVFMTFCGPRQHKPASNTGWAAGLPLLVLAALSTVVGIWLWRDSSPLEALGWLSDMLRPPQHGAVSLTAHPPAWVELCPILACLIGIAIAWFFWLHRPKLTESLARRPLAAALHRWWFAGWGFDWLYDKLFVRPVVYLARVNRDDIIDSFFDVLAYAAYMLHQAIRLTQNGQVRWYAAGLAFGAALVIAIVVMT